MLARAKTRIPKFKRDPFCPNRRQENEERRSTPIKCDPPTTVTCCSDNLEFKANIHYRGFLDLPALSSITIMIDLSVINETHPSRRCSDRTSVAPSKSTKTSHNSTINTGACFRSGDRPTDNKVAVCGEIALGAVLSRTSIF